MLSPQYIAGFLDGEGYFGILRQKNKFCKRGYRFTACIKIAQRERNSGILDLLNKQLGGNLDKTRTHGKNQADSRMITFSGNKRVLIVLDYVYEYLIIKKRQADILYKFLNVEYPTTRKPGIVDVEMEKMYSSKEELYNEIIKLNRRGKIGLAETE